MSDRPTIVTPEGVSLDLETAGPAARVMARLADLVLQMSVLGAVVFAVLEGSGGSASGAGVAGITASVFAVLFVYPVVTETWWRGRTVGKAMLGIRVLADDGAPSGFRHATVRAVMSIFDVYATVGWLAIVSVFLTRRHQRLGDLAAGTIVVRRPTGRDERPVVFQPQAHLVAFSEALPAHRLGDDEYQLVRDVILRLASLRADARRTLASGTAAMAAERIGEPRPPRMDAEAYLICVAAAAQRTGTTRSALGPVAPVAPVGSVAPVGPVAPVGSVGSVGSVAPVAATGEPGSNPATRAVDARPASADRVDIGRSVPDDGDEPPGPFVVPG